MPGPTSPRRESVAKFPRTPGAEKIPWRLRASPPALPSTVSPHPAPPARLWRRSNGVSGNVPGDYVLGDYVPGDYVLACQEMY